MGFSKSSFAIACSLVVFLWTFRAAGQAVPETGSSRTVSATALSGQEFHCHTGYPLQQCQKDILQLKSILTHYPVQVLGHWTWVLVRSQDWKPIMRMLRLSPDSPAFTALELRETFLEEALFVHDPERTSELMMEWQSSMPKLLERAVSHELGHAFCSEPAETIATRIGEDLRKGLIPGCHNSSQARKQSVATGEPHDPQGTPRRAP